jgi:hypothetical protein
MLTFPVLTFFFRFHNKKSELQKDITYFTEPKENWVLAQSFNLKLKQQIRSNVSHIAFFSKEEFIMFYSDPNPSRCDDECGTLEAISPAITRQVLCRRQCVAPDLFGALYR